MLCTQMENMDTRNPANYPEFETGSMPEIWDAVLYCTTLQYGVGVRQTPSAELCACYIITHSIRFSRKCVPE